MFLSGVSIKVKVRVRVRVNPLTITFMHSYIVGFSPAGDFYRGSVLRSVNLGESCELG